jgi:hypothetical protein
VGLLQHLDAAAASPDTSSLDPAPPNRSGPARTAQNTRFKVGTWLPDWQRVSWLTVGVIIGGIAGYQLGVTRQAVLGQTNNEAVLSRSFDNGGPPPTTERSRVEVPSDVPSDLPAEGSSKGQAEPIRKIGASRLPAAKTESIAQTTAESGQAVNDEEVFLLQRVERALRQKNARVALGLLRELDEKSAHGRLQQERFAARVLALCLIAAPNAAAEAAEFDKRYPNSVHQRRIIGACQQ